VNKITSYDTQCIPADTLIGFVEITVVVTEGIIGDRAAYVGSGGRDWVASNGNKLSFAQAQSYFPWLVEKNYRST